MIEMLNPTLGDAGRFARETLAFRLAYARASQERATEMAVARFCSPKGRRDFPNMIALQHDAWRYAKTRMEDIAEPQATSIETILRTTQKQVIPFGKEQITTYRWQPLKAPTSQATSQAAKPTQAPRVLFVHGWEGYALNFALMIGQYLQAGYEVFGFDHLAHGQSTGHLAGLPSFIEGLARVNEHFGMQHRSWDSVVGHSLGAGAVLYSAAYGRLKAHRIALLAPFIDTPHLLKRWAQLHGLSSTAAVLMEREIERQSVIPGMRMRDMLPRALAGKIKARLFIAHDPKDIVVPIDGSQALASKHAQAQLLPRPQAGHVGLLFDDKLVGEFLRA